MNKGHFYTVTSRFRPWRQSDSAL